MRESHVQILLGQMMRIDQNVAVLIWASGEEGRGH